MTSQLITKAAKSAYARTLAALSERWPADAARKRATEDAADVAHYLAAEAEVTGFFDRSTLTWTTSGHEGEAS